MKRPSLREAIDRMCKDCLFDPTHAEGKWVQQITNCTAWSCPLFTVRAITKGEGGIHNAKEFLLREEKGRKAYFADTNNKGGH